MTTRDRESVRNLYYIHRFNRSSIAMLFGVSHEAIRKITNKNMDIMIVSDVECLLCGLADSDTFYIDGDRDNKNPQNLIMLCEADRRRIKPMQLRKRKGFVIPQS